METRNIKKQSALVAKEKQGETFHKLAQLYITQDSQKPEIQPKKKGNNNMKTSTKDLYEKQVSGHTIDEISAETGIGKWALYKRFQRLKDLESTQENNSKDDTIDENIISSTDESQIGKSKGSDRTYAVLVFATILVTFLLYRKYNSNKLFMETKQIPNTFLFFPLFVSGKESFFQ